MIRILTDSASDILPAEAEQLGVTVIPLNVTLEDGTVLRDGVDMTPTVYYGVMARCHKLPTTSQPSPELFQRFFLEAAAAGDEVVGIFLSHALSGTCQCARLAADMANVDNVLFVDSENVCLGESLLVRLAVQLRDAGKTAGQIAATLEHAKEHLHLVAVIDDLKYLRKGGRLPAAVAVAGGMLGIKPLITIKEGKVELGYFPGDNEFHCAAGQTVAPPELGFLFPAFDDRAANIYNALFYSRKANEIHQEFIDAIFHVEAPMSAVEQKEAFQSALSDAFDCSLEVMQTVHEQLREKIKEHRESRSSEPLEMSASEIGQILQSCGIADEQVAAFQENCGEQFGSGVVLNPANLIDSSRFEIKTPEITISADPEYSYLVETQIINGRKYLLIPTEDGVEVNGFAVSITAAQKDD